MLGAGKLRTLLIGKSKKPPCFKQVKSLPLDYYAIQNYEMFSKLNFFSP
jgi:hypothetical protein